MIFDISLLVTIIFGLIQGSFILAIPLFFILLLGLFIKKKLSEAFAMNWLMSSFIVTFIFSLAFVCFIYFYPIIISIPQQTIGNIPSALQPTTAEWFGFWFYIFAKLLAVSLIISLILMPFILIGSFLLEKFNSIKSLKKLPSFARLFLALFIMLIFFSGLILYLFYWIPIGLIQLLYFT